MFDTITYFFHHPLGPKVGCRIQWALVRIMYEVHTWVSWMEVVQTLKAYRFVPIYCELECRLFVGMQPLFVVRKIPLNFALLIPHF